MQIAVNSAIRPKHTYFISQFNQSLLYMLWTDALMLAQNVVVIYYMKLSAYHVQRFSVT